MILCVDCFRLGVMNFPCKAKKKPPSVQHVSVSRDKSIALCELCCYGNSL